MRGEAISSDLRNTVMTDDDWTRIISEADVKIDLNVARHEIEETLRNFRQHRFGPRIESIAVSIPHDGADASRWMRVNLLQDHQRLRDAAEQMLAAYEENYHLHPNAANEDQQSVCDEVDHLCSELRRLIAHCQTETTYTNGAKD